MVGALKNPGFVKLVLREIMILQQINHPNILKLRDLCMDSSRTTLYTVTDLYDTDLSAVIHQSNQKINNSTIRHIMFQIFQGLAYLHSAGIVHRDLKPGNVFVIVKSVQIVIGDLGMARSIGHHYFEVFFFCLLLFFSLFFCKLTHIHITPTQIGR